MHFSSTFQILGLLLAPIVLASPLSERNSHTCRKDSVYDLFHQPGKLPAFKEFCWGYIHVPTSTVTVHRHPLKTVTHTVIATKDTTIDKITTKTKLITKTSTQQSTVVDTSSITVDVTSTATSQATTTETSFTTTVTEVDSTITSDITTTTSGTSTYMTTTTTTTSLPAPQIRKRGDHPWTKGYNPKQLSSACSCLSLTKTLTKTATDRPSTLTKVSHVVKTSTATSSETKSATSTLSTTIISTGTQTTSVSVTSSTTTTIQSIETDSTKVTLTTSFTSSTTTTDTASTETDVTTTSTTATATATCVPFVPLSFYLQISNWGGEDDGYYVQLASYGNYDYRVSALTPDLASATLFSISDSFGHVTGQSGAMTDTAVQGTNTYDQPLFFAPSAYFSVNTLASCSISDEVFTCSDQSDNSFQTGYFNSYSTTNRVLALVGEDNNAGGFISSVQDVGVNVVGVGGAGVPDFSTSPYFC